MNWWARPGRLADALGQEVVAVLAGDHIESKASALIAHGADKVIVADHPMLAEYSTKPYTEVMEKVIKDYAPEVVLFGASSIGRDLAPSVSATVHTGPDRRLHRPGHRRCGEDRHQRRRQGQDRGQDRRAGPGRHRGGQQQDHDHQGRQGDQCRQREVHLSQAAAHDPSAFGGNIIATIACLQHRPQMATVRPGVMQALACRRQPHRRGHQAGHHPHQQRGGAGDRQVHQGVQGHHRGQDSGLRRPRHRQRREGVHGAGSGRRPGRRHLLLPCRH